MNSVNYIEKKPLEVIDEEGDVWPESTECHKCGDNMYREDRIDSGFRYFCYGCETEGIFAEPPM